MEASLQTLNLKIPRTKFKFKRKNEIQAKQKKKTENDEEKQDEFVKTIKGLVDLKDQTIELKQDDLEGNFKLFNLENCIIKMEGHINMLFLRDLKNCEIHTCAVSNSIMGHYLTDCKISLIGHQIRLHNSFDTHFYVYTTSKLIIEDCSRLTFHELQYTYRNLENDLEKAGLHGHNYWKDVQDFKWIKKEKSPNFCLVFDGKEQAPEEETSAPIFNIAPKIQPEDLKPKVGITAMASNVEDFHYHPGYQIEAPVDIPEKPQNTPHALGTNQPTNAPVKIEVPSQQEVKKPELAPKPSPVISQDEKKAEPAKEASDDEIDEL